MAKKIIHHFTDNTVSDELVGEALNQAKEGLESYSLEDVLEREREHLDDAHAKRLVAAAFAVVSSDGKFHDDESTVFTTITNAFGYDGEWISSTLKELAATS